jgi:hypothetical protein
MLKHKISVISLGEEYCTAYVGALLVIGGNSGLSLLRLLLRLLLAGKCYFGAKD